MSRPETDPGRERPSGLGALLGSVMHRVRVAGALRGPIAMAAVMLSAILAMTALLAGYAAARWVLLILFALLVLSFCGMVWFMLITNPDSLQSEDHQHTQRLLRFAEMRFEQEPLSVNDITSLSEALRRDGPALLKGTDVEGTDQDE